MFGFNEPGVMPLTVDFPELDLSWLDDDEDESGSGLLI